MSGAAGFAVNGRFLTQEVTGVQRYARNVLAALDGILGAEKLSAPVLAPAGAADPGLAALPLTVGGPLSGHAWEQIVLPSKWRGRLLNLCNTAPAVRADQVVCIHDANVLISPESYSRSFRCLYGMLQPRLARRAARITTVSQAAARQLARHLPVRAADIAVLPNGHEHALAWDPALAEAAPPLIEAIRGTANRRYVLALGSRAQHKNIGLLAELAPGLSELGIDIVVAGGGGGIFAEGALREAPNLHAIGRVSDHDIACLMEHALCLVFPSFTEGFGLPIIEAMARGCPVISSDRASMPEVCGDAALLASPEKPVDWLAQLERLAGSATLRADLSGRGRGRVELFRWSETAAGYLELLRDPSARRINPAATGLSLASAPGLPAPGLPGAGLPAAKTPGPVTSASLTPAPVTIANASAVNGSVVNGSALPAATEKVGVVIATRGRPDVVSATVRHLLATQTLRPAAFVISCIDEADAGGLGEVEGIEVVTGPAGLPSQRNTGMAALPPDIDIIAFFDDDFVADPHWLAAAAQTFRDESSLVGFTGRVLADGAIGPGIAFDEAVAIIAGAQDAADEAWEEPYCPYGCNMAFRASAIGDLRFDERLVLYGWLEDRDFATALGNMGGRLAKDATARGVHMGVKGGRVSGDRFGYSQIVNPVYMLRKGTMTPGLLFYHISRNVASNLAGAIKSEPFVDRRGRLRGNLLGAADVLRGRIEPERAAEIRA